MLEVRHIPCGKCNCGVYSTLATLNKYARKLGALEEDERLQNISHCKIDPGLLCAGEMDFHNMLIKIDNQRRLK